MDQYGRQRVEQFLPKVVRTMQTEFRKAKSFGATRWHFPAILDKYEINRQRGRDEHLKAVTEEIKESQVSPDEARSKTHERAITGDLGRSVGSAEGRSGTTGL